MKIITFHGSYLNVGLRRRHWQRLPRTSTMSCALACATYIATKSHLLAASSNVKPLASVSLHGPGAAPLGQYRTREIFSRMIIFSSFRHSRLNRYGLSKWRLDSVIINNTGARFHYKVMHLDDVTAVALLTCRKSI